MNIDFQPLDHNEEKSSSTGLDFQKQPDEMVDTLIGKLPKHPSIQNLMGKKPTLEDVKNRTKGLAQGAENVGIGYLNFLPGVNISKAQWAGESPEAKQGEMASELGSFLLPGGIFKSAKYIPMIGNALKASVRGLESRPIINALAKLGKSTGESAISSAALADKEKQGEAAKTGAEFGAGTNVLTQLLGLKNPVLNAILRAGFGAAGGYGVNALTGAGRPYESTAAGAALGIAGPKTAKALGFGGQPGMEALEHLTQEEVAPTMKAARNLGTPITPSEASGNPFVGGIEGSYGRTGEAAALKTKIGQERVLQQNAAIKDLMDTIYDKSPASKEKIANLYKQANQWDLKPNVLEQFKTDPVIESAFKRVQSDPAYQRKLQGIPENNYAYLNQVKRALSDMEGAAIKAGEKDRAAEFKEARNNLVGVMDNSVPAYGAARQEAQKSIIRSNIQKAMKKKELKGSSFYNTILKNDDEFNKLHDSLKNVPEAQDKLNDMRLAWKNLIDIEKPKNAAFRAETGLNQSRNWASKLVDMWNEMSGAKRNIEALRFIHSPEWDKSFSKIAEIKDTSKRKEAAANLIAKLATAYEVKKSQGSGKNDNILQPST